MPPLGELFAHENALIGGARISMISPNQRIRNMKSSEKITLLENGGLEIPNK